MHLRNVKTLVIEKGPSPYEIYNATFLGNESRNWYGNYCGDSLNLKWKYFLGSGKTIVTAEAGVEVWAGAGWTGQPLITKENGVEYIYQGAFDHHLKKLSLDSGKLVWEYEFDDILKGTGTLLLNESAKDTMNRLMIFQGSRKGFQYSVSDTGVASFRAISCLSGKEQWRMPMKHTACYSSDVDASPLFINGTGFIGLENGYFVSFDPEAQNKWKDTLSRPTIFTSDLLYNEEDHAAHGGNLVTEASPTRLGNHLYIASGAGHIFGYNLESKLIDWDLKISSDIDGTPVVTSDNCLLIAIEKQYIPGHGGIMKINPAREPDKCVDWYYPTKDRNFSSWIGGVIGSVTVNDNYRDGNDPYLAAFTGIDGILTVVDYLHTTGEKVAGPNGITMYETPRVHFTKDIGPAISTPMFSGGHLIAANYTGIFIFRHDSAWNFIQTAFQPGMFEASPVSHNGNVIIASRDGYLYCYGTGETQIANVPNIKVVPQPIDVAVNIPPAKTVVKHAGKTTPQEKVKSLPDTITKYIASNVSRDLRSSAFFGKTKHNEPAITPVTKPAIVAPVISTGNCFLIAGVFRSEENALNYTAKWTKRGYAAEMITQPSGMHYVSIMRGESEQVLLEKRKTIELGKDPLPWVWVSQE
jgi:outer membrane protein assembly factor BamB